MAKFVINRPKDLFKLYGTSAKVIVDGMVIGEIKDGEKKSFDIAPGNHILRVCFGALSGTSKEIHLTVVENDFLIKFTQDRGWIAITFVLVVGMASVIGIMSMMHGLFNIWPLLILFFIIGVIAEQILSKKILLLEVSKEEEN